MGYFYNILILLLLCDVPDGVVQVVDRLLKADVIPSGFRLSTLATLGLVRTCVIEHMMM